MTQFPQLSFAGLEDYEPWAGGGHGFVPREGKYRVKINGATPDMTKNGDKAFVKVECVVQDADAIGIPLIGRAIYHGADKNGKTLARQFGDLLVSSGTAAEQIRNHAKQGTSMPIEQAIAQLKDREAFVEVKFEVYEGELRSNIDSFISPEVYAKAVEAKSHRGRTPDQFQTTQIGGAGAGAGGFGGGAVNLGGPQGATANGAVVQAAVQPQQNAVVPSL